MQPLESFSTISDETQARFGQVFWLAFALLAITGAAYLPVLRNGFVDYDDSIYVTASRHVQQGLTPESLHFAWTTTAHGNWHPLTWMSLELDQTLYGPNARGFHITSLVLHCASVLLLFIWLNLSTGAPGRSAAAMAIFAVHPLHVESVAWVAERKDVLCLLFLALTLLAYRSYSQKPGWLRYLVVSIAFAGALLSKPVAVTIPILLLLVDYWPGSRWKEVGWRQLVLEKLPWLLMSLAIGMVTIQAQSQSGNILDADTLSWSSRAGTALVGYGFYLEKTFWPTGLAAFYPHFGSDIPWLRAGVSALCLIFCTALVVLKGRRFPWLVFGWGWFVISLLPVIGLLQVGQQAYADRYSYLPHIGLLILIVWQASEALANWRVPTIFSRGLCTVLVLTCAVLTFQQTGTWRNTATLWTHAISVSDNNWHAHYALGVHHSQENEFELAKRHFDRMRELRPADARSYAEPGAIAVLEENWELGESLLVRAIELEPQHQQAHFNLFYVHSHFERPAEALEALRRHCDIVHHDWQAQSQLAVILAKVEGIEPALRQCQRMLDFDSSNAAAHEVAARLLAEAGRPEDAKLRLLEVLRLDPKNFRAQIWLGDYSSREKKPDEAAQFYRAALRIKPDHTQTIAKLKSLGARQ